MTYSEYRNQFSNVESFRRAYGNLTYEAVKALIDAEESSPSIKAAMMTTWYHARREVKLRNIDIRLREDDGLSIVFYEYDSEFDGNDFEYRYLLDPANKEKFLKGIPRNYDDVKTDIEEWLVKNINCEGFGWDLREKWVQMGLHGTRIVWEDYPGGIYREEPF